MATCPVLPGPEITTLKAVHPIKHLLIILDSRGCSDDLNLGLEIAYLWTHEKVGMPRGKCQLNVDCS